MTTKAGTDSDWQAALSAVKAAFPIEDRIWHGEGGGEKLWSVPATTENRRRLIALFANAESAFVALEAQLSLF